MSLSAFDYQKINCQRFCNNQLGPVLVIYEANMSLFAGSSFYIMGICCFSPFKPNINGIYLDFKLLVEQNNQFPDVTMDSWKLFSVFSDILLMKLDHSGGETILKLFKIKSEFKRDPCLI